MTVNCYRASKIDDVINNLGELGWQATPPQTYLYREYETDPASNQFVSSMAAFLERKSQDKTNRKNLTGLGFRFLRVYDDSLGRKTWKLDVSDPACPLRFWRIEFDYAEEDPVVGITLADQRIIRNVFVNREIVDSQVPEEILNDAIRVGALRKGSVSDE